MANYKDLHGFQIKHRSSDPSNPIKGEIWYNTTTQTLKGYQSKGAAWESSNNLNTGTHDGRAMGAQGAAMSVGGSSSDNPVSQATEDYDGSSWTSGPNLNTGRATFGISQAGTQTAAFIAAGQGPAVPGNSNATEEFDGSSWTAGNNYPIASVIGGTGTLTAGLGFSGYTSPGQNYRNVSAEYDGTNWTAGNNINTNRSRMQGVGTQTATIAAGGFLPGDTNSNNCESYNGTTWTNTPNLTSTYDLAGYFGIQTAAIHFGGKTDTQNNTPSTGITTTSYWNGSSWSNVSATLSTGKSRQHAAGTAVTAGLSAGGNSNSNTTEEYNDPAFGIRTWDTT